MELSKKALGIKPSSTLIITAKAGDLKAAGKDVVGFGAGEPDFDTPEHIKKAAYDAIAGGFTKYTAAAGIMELRKAVCKKFKDDNGLSYEPAQVIVSTGAKQCLVNSFLAVLNDGDEVIVPSPYWLSYAELIKIAGGVPVAMPLTKENNFIPTKKDLESVYTDRTKAFVLNSPNNPTGVVFSEENLRVIADFAVEKDIVVISDEIYEKLIFDDDKKHISIASLGEEIYNRTIVINGVSKSYAMTGWRIGFSAAPMPIARLMNSIQSHMSSNANSIAQKATLAALTGPQDCVSDMRKEFAKRRDYIYDRGRKLPYVSVIRPEGAFYMFVDASGVFGKTYKGEKINNASDFARLLIEDKLVAIVPCADFGMADYIRLSYATSMERIETGMNRIEEFLNELK